MPGFQSIPTSARNSVRASGLLGSNLNVLLSARKDLPITPSTKMKQLQWDKLPQQQVSKTLWEDEEPQKEQDMLKKLQLDGVWMEMEEDFKAKQLLITFMGEFWFHLYAPLLMWLCSRSSKTC
jgi:cytokinesis protein